LISDGSNCCDILAPYQPGTNISDYAIVVKMRVTSGNGFIGIVARASGAVNNLTGYWAGVDSLQDLGNGQFSGNASIAHIAASQDLVSIPYTLDTAWHTYTLKVDSNHIKLFIDNGSSPVVQTTDKAYLSGGKVGLRAGSYYANIPGAQVQVSSFQVFSLQEDHWHVQYEQWFYLPPMQGMGAQFGIYRPVVNVRAAITNRAIESLAQVAAEDLGGHDIEVGWIVGPYYHDTAPHLLIYTRDGNNTCLVGDPNCNKKDWVQLSSTFHPNDPIDTTKSPAAFIEVLHYKGAWFVLFYNQWVGYFPDSHWSNNGFQSVAHALWFGEVAAETYYPCIQMGNSVFGHNTGSAIIDNMFLFDPFGGHPLAGATRVSPENTGYYDDGHATGHSFTYGGPGYCP
jgi:hypothetical protein